MLERGGGGASQLDVGSAGKNCDATLQKRVKGAYHGNCLRHVVMVSGHC